MLLFFLYCVVGVKLSVQELELLVLLEFYLMKNTPREFLGWIKLTSPEFQLECNELMVM